MSGECVMVPEIFRDILERVEMLATEAGNLGRSNGVLREELDKAQKECQELRDALEEAVQGIQAREAEKRANQAGGTAIDAGLIHSMLDRAGAVKVASWTVLDRLEHSLAELSMMRVSARTTQDG